MVPATSGGLKEADVALLAVYAPLQFRLTLRR
jgi:hypothetical protein